MVDDPPTTKVLGDCLVDLANGINAQVELARVAVRCSAHLSVPYSQPLGRLAEAVHAFAGDVLAELETSCEDPALPPEMAAEEASRSPCASSGKSDTCHSGKVKEWPFWAEPAGSPLYGVRKTLSTEVMEDMQRSLHCSKEIFGSATMESDHRFWGKFILRPGSTQQLVWHCLTTIIISYELLSLPLMVFGYDELRAAHTLRLITASFWALDFVANFFQGFEVDGRVEMHPQAIAKRYLRTWLVPDVALLGFDWVMIYAAVESGLVTVGRMSKAGRYLRILRLIRVMQTTKVSELLARITETAVDAKRDAVLTIVKLLVLLACICHFVGCGWYAVGTVGQSDLTGSWVAELASEGASMVHRYVVSFHWAFSQFTPCSSPYHPQTLREEVFNVSLLGLGFVLFTSSLGIITSTITAVQRQAAEQSRERALLHRYLNERSVSWKLGHQIMTFCRQSNKKKPEVLECDVALVKLLPEQLLKSLHFEVRGPIITSYPLFEHFFHHFPAALQSIAHIVAVQKVYYAEETVFSPGSDRTGMYVVSFGHFEYHPGEQRVVLPEFFRLGQWISEVGLWTPVQHSGHFIAKVFSSLIELDAKRLHATISKSHPDALHCLQAYARFVVAMVGDLGEQGYSGYDTWTDEHGADKMFRDASEPSSFRASKSYENPCNLKLDEMAFVTAGRDLMFQAKRSDGASACILQL